jgi:putative ABC transport system permease protein
LSPDAPSTAPGHAPLAAAVGILPGHFATLGLPLRRGRAFTEADVLHGEPVAVLGESLAAALWPDEEAVGRLLTLTLADGTARSHRIVGVVADARRRSAGSPPPRELYLPLHAVGSELVLIARTPADGALEPALRAALRDAGPNLALGVVQDIGARDTGRWQPRFFALVLGSFAAMTLIAAVIGLYGLTAGTVTQRRREFGLRLALGAVPKRLARGVVLEGMKLALYGALPALALSMLVAPRLAQVTRLDADGPPVVILLAAVFVVAVGVACWLPARRAAQVDPMASLRYD